MKSKIYSKHGSSHLGERGKRRKKKEKPKVCPNCGKAWSGITCNHCAFDASEVDIY